MHVRNDLRLADMNRRIALAIRLAKRAPTRRDAAIAWNVVEEICAARAHRLARMPDPMEAFCAEDPSAVECRVYDV